ncbi:MAG: D-alanyl-D-alanine carboxypeptidase/D-alanyl-D-alanine-endopeptidase [Mangrovibacterium sp.]
MKKLFFLNLLFLLFCCLSSVKLRAQNSAQLAIQRFEADEQLKGTSIGFYAIDAQTGSLIASSQNQLNLTPASVLKLATTTAALDILGTDYQFTTVFGRNSTSVDGKTKQNLILTAGGDPTIGSKYFFSSGSANQLVKDWAHIIYNRIHAKSIHQLIIDLSIYDKQYIPNTWIWEDMGNYYGAGVYALSAYDNMCTLHFRSPAEPGKLTAITGVSPHYANIKFDNEVLSSDINKDKAYVFGSPFDNYRVVRGTIPKNRTDFKVKAALPSPPQTLANELADELESLGIKVDNVKLTYTPTTPKDTLFIYHSPKLKQIVKVTNHESVNLFAEHLVKQLAYEKYGQGNFRQGIVIIQNYWRNKGIDLPYMEDGSGLSRFDAITAEQLCKIVYSAYQNPKISNAFLNSLPIAPNGTLWYFSKGIFNNNCLRAKSGSMTRIRSFAGELKTDSGRTVLFALITNNFPVNQNILIKKIQVLLNNIKTMY